MITELNEPIGPVAPTAADVSVAAQSGQRLANLVAAGRRFKVATRDGRRESVELPASAIPLLIEMLKQMARGHAVTLIPMHAELTTQQAADLLNVSRPFVVKLIEQQQLPCRKVGKHRRIRYADVLALKQRSEAQRRAALQQLVQEGQALDLGY